MGGKGFRNQTEVMKILLLILGLGTLACYGSPMYGYRSGAPRPLKMPYFKPAPAQLRRKVRQVGGYGYLIQRTGRSRLPRASCPGCPGHPSDRRIRRPNKWVPRTYEQYGRHRYTGRTNPYRRHQTNFGQCVKPSSRWRFIPKCNSATARSRRRLLINNQNLHINLINFERKLSYL